MHMVAHAKDEREKWKRTSMLAYNIGRFGNSDPKKFPATIKKYMPELWDDVEDSDINNDPLIRSRKSKATKNRKWMNKSKSVL
jgi:hypothetical protein